MTGLGVIRNLGRKGVPVYLVIEEKDEATYSKYCKKYFIFPGISQNLEKLVTILSKIQSQVNRPMVLFPTSDLLALNVSLLKDQTDSYLIPIADREVLEILVEKRKFYESLGNLRIPHPSTYFLKDDTEFAGISDEVQYPVYIRPSISTTFAEIFQKKGFVANREEELLNYMNMGWKYGFELLLQEIIPGDPTDHYFIDGYLDKKSKPLAVFARRRLRMFPLNFGNSTACVTIPLSKVSVMKETIINYLQSISFHGIFSVEFKVDPRDNTPKMLEVNARSWWYNSFPAECGIDIIYTAYLDALEKPIRPQEKYKDNVKLIYILQDIMSSLTMFARRTLHHTEWASSLKGEKHYALFAEDDLLPFITSFPYFFRRNAPQMIRQLI